MNDEPDDMPPQDDARVETPPPPPHNGNGETITDQVRSAREAIPVDDRGVRPTAYSQQIDIAKDRSRAYLMLPQHLHDNAAVMTALVGIASRFNLDPIMLASQTYIQNNRLCFQSQAFGAILYASGLLRGRLRYDFNGEGDEMTCTVSGKFKDDPDAICAATTPTLKELHPGRTQKEGKTFVRGSPLWDKDAEQQMAYFAQRRWIRRFAPDCVMGMYTREEIMELDDYRAQSGAIPLTVDRLGQLNTGEGWGDGSHLDTDLASIAPEIPDEPKAEVEVQLPPPQKKPRIAQRKTVQAKKPVTRVKVAPVVKTAPAKPAEVRRRGPSPAEVKAVADRAEAGQRRPTPPMTPRWVNYVQAAEAWINAGIKDPEAADARWEQERDERDRLAVPMGERSRLRAVLDRKIAQLKPPKEEEEE